MWGAFGQALEKKLGVQLNLIPSGGGKEPSERQWSLSISGGDMAALDEVGAYVRGVGRATAAAGDATVAALLENKGAKLRDLERASGALVQLPPRNRNQGGGGGGGAGALTLTGAPAAIKVRHAPRAHLGPWC
jgi:hypothetical protein